MGHVPNLSTFQSFDGADAPHDHSGGKLLDEAGRLAAVRRLDVVGTPSEAAFDHITDLVCSVFDVSISSVSLVDEEIVWLKSVRGYTPHQAPRSTAFCALTIASREAVIINDAATDPRVAGNPHVTGDPYVRSYAGVPLRSPDGYNLGALCAADQRPRAFSDQQLAMLHRFAGIVVNELELRTIARRDHLTGALSRRAFVEQALGEIGRSYRHQRPCSLAVLDVDHFKAVNDRFGHPAGDQVLRAMAATCRRTLRPHDVFGRLGGEEFAILLPETDLAAAMQASERVRAAICAMDPAFEGAPPLSASFGVATLGSAVTRTWEGLLAVADAALYVAKRGGRNRCQAADHSLTRAAA